MGEEQALKMCAAPGEHKLSTKTAEMDHERRRLERYEDMVQIVLAAIVPGLLASMMFCYFIFPFFSPFMLGLALILSSSTLLPAYRIHNLHYKTWSRNSLVPKMMTAIVGMIYISIVSIFAVSMMSLFEGFDPEQPATFATVGALILALLAVMTYDSRTKESYMRSEKRYFRFPAAAMEERLAIRLDKDGKKYNRERNHKGAIFKFEGGMNVFIRPLGNRHCEVLVRDINESGMQFLPKLKALIECA